MIQSEPRGLRSGRPQVPIPKAVREVLYRALVAVDEEGAPAQTLEEIARELNDLEPRPPRPGRHRDEPWNPPAVRNAFLGLRRKELALLLRMGSLLEAMDRRDEPVRVPDLLDLCDRHQVDVYWLWDRYQLGPAIDLTSSVLPEGVPPIKIDRRVALAELTDKGREIITLYRQADRYPHAIQDVAAAIFRRPGPVSRAGVRRMGRWFGARLEDLLAARLVVANNGNVTLTKRGQEVGSAWDRIIFEPEEEGRVGYEFGPDPDELRLLGDDWDWTQRPPIPSATDLGIRR